MMYKFKDRNHKGAEALLQNELRRRVGENS